MSIYKTIESTAFIMELLEHLLRILFFCDIPN